MVALGVVGGSGGVGASTLACALGVAAARLGMRAAVLDGAAEGGGVQVTAGVEHLPGHRWADLIEIDGSLDGDRLRAELPAIGECVFVSAGIGPTSPLGMPDEVSVVALRSVFMALAECSDLLILDWGRGGEPVDVTSGREREPDTILLAQVSARGLADAQVWVHRHPCVRLAGVVTRSERHDPTLAESVAESMALPLLGCLPDERSVRRAADSGLAPGAGRGALHRLAEQLVLAALSELAVPDRGAVAARR